MTKSTQKFLRFNDQTLLFLSIDNTYWIAIKPICDALSLEWTRQFKNLKEDKILSQLLAEQPMVAADKKTRNMVCLPEEWIYGWLFSVRSDSPELHQFKQECYHILFNHFHGSMTERLTVLTEKTAVEIEIEQAEAELRESAAYKKVQNLKAKAKEKRQLLTQMDRDLSQGQLSLFGELLEN